ncbi:mechanosensitive ion channel protein MscS [Halorhodospira neutriphila]|uniref:Mechanosensitive ion channel protein MscS n=1 Tax=Halorhodospira neutriphila TaxID=168379 RepID=A0ABS1E401_9GAMM|nr:mechanosensitive ion channel protein MscS [Halorhodospira neutriphila]
MKPLARLGGGLLALLLPALAAGAEGGEEAVTPARRVAEATQGLAQSLGGQIGEIGEAFSALEAEALGPQLLELALQLTDLALVILTAVGLLLLLRPAVRPLFGRIERWARGGDERLRAVRRTAGVLGAALADAAVVLVAWVGGYAVALFALGDFGAIELRQSMFLNAFLLIEALKALLRVFFAAKHEHLRLIPLGDALAAYWNTRLARMAGLIGYGLLFLVPLARRTVSTGLGELATLLVMALAFLYALYLALRNRRDVRERLHAQAAASELLFTRTVLALLAHLWHWAVIAYFGALAVVTVTRPESALPFMAQGTIQSVGAIAVGALLLLTLEQATARRIRLSEAKRRRFPMLEQRLNGYVPIVLKGVRAVILVSAVALVLDAWGLLDFTGWLGSPAGLGLISTALSVALILAAATAAWLIAATWIEYRLNPDGGRRSRPTAREQTLLTLFRNALAVTLVTVTVMIVLAEIGINIGPLIAGAGVLGLAIGFGAQKLVQDIITGVFIQLENAIDVGDVITAAGITGTVEKLTIRSVNIRDLAGTYHFVPFSSVDSVSNFTRHFAYHVGQYGVAYHEDIDRVIPELQAAYEDLKQDPEVAPALRDDFAIDGVTTLGESSVDFRVRIKTEAGMQWAVGRAYNRLVKKRLDAAGIEIPYPHRTIYFGHEGQEAQQALEQRFGGAPGVRATPDTPGPDSQQGEEDA